MALIIAGSNAARNQEELQKSLATGNYAGQDVSVVTAPIGGNSGNVAGESLANYQTRTGSSSNYQSITSLNTAPTNGLAGQVSTYVPPSVPNVQGLSEITPQDYQVKQGETPEAYNTRIAGLRGTAQTDELTGASKNVQDIIDRILVQNTDLAGKESYRVQQEGNQDIVGKSATVRDYTAQLLALKNEQAAIPLSAAGVNQTAGMLGAQQAEQNRQVAVKALTVSAQLEAAKGNLQLALDTVDRLVKVKYADEEAKRDANLANAELIMKSPLYTVEEKKRAAAITAQAKKDTDAQQAKEQITKDIMSTLNDPDFQGSAPASVKKQLSDLAVKNNLTQADAVLAANLGAKWKKATPADNLRNIKTQAFAIASPLLNATKGTDGYVDPAKYVDLRQQYTEVVGDPSGFDDLFASSLSPQERANLGVGKAVGLKAEQPTTSSAGFWDWLGNIF